MSEESWKDRVTREHAQRVAAELRDRLAIAAMQASLTGGRWPWDAEACRMCYEIADRMLQARAEATPLDPQPPLEEGDR